MSLSIPGLSLSVFSFLLYLDVSIVVSEGRLCVRSLVFKSSRYLLAAVSLFDVSVRCPPTDFSITHDIQLKLAFEYHHLVAALFARFNRRFTQQSEPNQYTDVHNDGF